MRNISLVGFLHDLPNCLFADLVIADLPILPNYQNSSHFLRPPSIDRVNSRIITDFTNRLQN